MPNKVHVPGLGEVPRGGLIAGVLAGAGGGIYLYIRHKNAAATTASTTTTPAAGYGYGYAGQEYGYNNPAFNEPYIGGEYGYGGLYGYGIGEGYGVGTPYPPGVPTQVASTNAAWAQAAETYLSQTGGYDPETVAGALGVYISGGSMSANQQAIAEAAIAFEGYPPVPGASGYPPAMHTSPPVSTQPKPPTGIGPGGSVPPPAGAKVTVPITFGESADTAIQKLQSAGFRVVTNPQRNPANEYKSTGSKPRGGSKAAKGSTVTLGVKISKRGK